MGQEGNFVDLVSRVKRYNLYGDALLLNADDDVFPPFTSRRGNPRDSPPPNRFEVESFHPTDSIVTEDSGIRGRSIRVHSSQFRLVGSSFVPRVSARGGRAAEIRPLTELRPLVKLTFA